jgi:hypothetical protein
VVMYCSAAALESRPGLTAHLCQENDPGIEWIHWDIVQCLEKGMVVTTPGKKLAGALLSRIWRRIF